MKKFLSLVLALVMAMSLVTVSAGAKEFKDMADAEQAYKEAIDVISDLGIVGGVTADTFQPDGKLTRGAATKFVANLMLGPDLAAKLPDGAPFTDVPAGSTFAKYANYLKSRGVIGGYGDGSYGVKNDLTGDAFLKMVLGALGYDASAEGYGTVDKKVEGWQVNVALDAIEAGLVKGLPANFDSSKVITREVAAQIVLNALEAKTVFYETNGSISIGNVVITNNSKAKPVESTAADYDRAVTAATGDGYQQLVEKLFPGVQKDEAAADAFMRPATAWYDAENEQIVLTVDAPAKVYATKQTHKTIYTALGLKSTDDLDFVRYVNGYTQSSYAGTLSSTSTSDYIGGSVGSTVEIYYDKTLAAPITAIQIGEYIGEVTTVTPASGSTKRSITITPLNASYKPSSSKNTYTFTTDSFAEGDIVVYTYSSKAGVAAVQSVELAQAKVGEYTKLEGTTKVYIDGAGLTRAETGPAFAHTSAVDFGDTLRAYLNSNGYYLYVEKVTDAALTQDKCAYVLAATTIPGEADWATGDVAADTHKAQLLFVDGTTEIVEVKEPATTLVNNFVKYGVNAKGQYELTDKTSGAVSDASVAITKGAVQATVNGASVLVNNATTFIVKTEKTVGEETETVYTLYVGYKAVPTITGTGKSDVVFKADADGNDTTTAAYVFVDATATGFVVDHENDLTDLIVVTKSSTTKYTDKNGAYYNAKALIDGELKSIVLTGDAFNACNYTFFNQFSSYSIDENGRYELSVDNRLEIDFENSDSDASTQGVKYDDGLLTLGSDNYALAEDAIIVYFSTKSSASTSTIWTVADLAAYNDTTSASNSTANDWYWGQLNEAGEVELLYISLR